MDKKKTTTNKKAKVLETYDEAVKDLFPSIQREKEESLNEDQNKRMKELAESVLSRF